MKSLVAYSSVVHIGVITLGALSGLELGTCSACGMLIGHSLLSPLIFLLAFELYLSSGSRSFASCFSRSMPPLILFWVSLCSGINFGLPPFLNFWVEVSLFSIQGRLWVSSLLPLIATAFLSFLFCILFYVLACAGPASSLLQLPHSSFLFFPSLMLLFGFPFLGPSLLTF